MGSVQIDTTHDGNRAYGPSPARQLWRFARLVLVLMAVVAGLLAMHVLGGHLAGHVAGSAGTSGEHGVHAAGPTHVVSASDACAHGQPAPAGSAVHCTPAPGALPPAPPAVVALERSDALQPAPQSAVPVAAQPRAPTPDLAELSISRT